MRFSVLTVVAALAAAAAAAPAALASPLLHAANGLELPPDRPAQDFYLRIMPFGASITYGLKSPDGNGYRKGLRDALRKFGWKVNMVGSVKAGNMTDNDNAGFPGLRVDQMFDKAKANMPLYMPNVILINCGTNDAVQNYKVNTTGQRMESLMDYIWSVVPDSVIVLSTILTQKPNPAGVEDINRQYRSIIARLQHAGKKIVLAEMDDGWITVDQLVDGIHPNEGGYLKMAARFDQAINTANDKNWIDPPTSTGTDDASVTDDTPCQTSS